uniref:Uncharacterized protein LOC102801254 n=1 Tax=Saccoglossus kowalevskii TaxID=10224 RepID=A0ABM0MPA3_SACKO|nr:PREDICTED: uncharacterized protein LOC102801254 [Saccoglossus kowalevskii]
MSHDYVFVPVVDQYFLIEPSDVTVRLNEEAYFECAVGAKSGQLTWAFQNLTGDLVILSLENAVLANTSDISVESPREGIDYNLRLRAVNADDAGDYMCIISGHGDDAATDHKVSQKAKLTVTLPTTARPPTTTAACIFKTPSHICEEFPSQEDYFRSESSISFENIVWNEDLEDSSSCLFNNEAVKVSNILHAVFNASQARDYIPCMEITGFRLVQTDGVDDIKADVIIPVLKSGGVSEMELTHAFQCGILRTNLNSTKVNPQQEAMLDYYCEYQDPTTTPLPVITTPIHTTITTEPPPPPPPPCVRTTATKACYRAPTKKTTVHLSLMTRTTWKWKDELRDRLACYFHNVGANVSQSVEYFNYRLVSSLDRRSVPSDNLNNVSTEAGDAIDIFVQFGVENKYSANFTEEELDMFLRSLLEEEINSGTDGSGIGIVFYEMETDFVEPGSLEEPTEGVGGNDTEKLVMIIVLSMAAFFMVLGSVVGMRLVVRRMTRMPPELARKIQQKRKEKAARANRGLRYAERGEDDGTSDAKTKANTETEKGARKNTKGEYEMKQHGPRNSMQLDAQMQYAPNGSHNIHRDPQMQHRSTGPRDMQLNPIMQYCPAGPRNMQIDPRVLYGPIGSRNMQMEPRMQCVPTGPHNMQLNPDGSHMETGSMNPMFMHNTCISAEPMQSHPHVDVFSGRAPPTHTNERRLSREAGLTSRRFAEPAGSLHELTKKNVVSDWTMQCQNAFDSLKDALISTPVLAFQSENETFKLDTDASGCGIGVFCPRYRTGKNDLLVIQAGLCQLQSADIV